jgi:hypothetical protein
MELKIQRKNPGSVLYDRGEGFTAGAHFFFFTSFFIWTGGICQIPSLYHGKKCRCFEKHNVA